MRRSCERSANGARHGLCVRDRPDPATERHRRGHYGRTLEQFTELLLQMLETEQGGVQVYETTLRCVLNDELKEEWGRSIAPRPRNTSKS